jgi:hypothetical protein
VRIPKDAQDRYTLYERLAMACMVSQSSRKSQYERWKRYYMLGCDDSRNPNAVVNKIYPHVDQLTSFMYSQETTRFAVEIGTAASGLNLAYVPPINARVNEEWHSSDTDITFGVGLLWSWVYGTTLVKPLWKHDGIQCGIVEPHCFGVLREDSPKLTSQEAFCHEYLITKTQLANELDAAVLCGAITSDRVNQILAKVEASGSPQQGSTGGPANIVVTSIQPLIAGNNMMGGLDPNLYSMADYRPRVYENMIQMRELYVWNDAETTYQVVTMADPYIVIWDRPLKGKMGIEGEIPFIQICPSPALDYFWGYSEVERLIPLQDLRNDRMDQIRKMLDLQANPSWDLSGYTVTDEIWQGFQTPGGRIAGDMPNSKATPHQPVIPEDLFREVRELDSMFEEMSGVNNVLSGRGETGVRSSGHASQLAKLGSSRAKKRAMIVEDSLENVATYYLKMIRKFSQKHLRSEPIEQDDQGEEFIPEQFTNDFIVKVDAHSNSPIFMEDQRELVFACLKAGLIDKEHALDLLDISGKQLLKQVLKRKIEPAEAKAAAQKAQLELVKGAHKGGRK